MVRTSIRYSSEMGSSLKVTVIAVAVSLAMSGFGLSQDAPMPACPDDPKPAARRLPEQTEYWRSKIVERSDGLVVWRAESGRELINPGALGERLVGVKPDVALTPAQAAALKWISDNATALPAGGDAVTWYADYQTNYGDLLIDPPWSGGYQQASIIAGLIAMHSGHSQDGWLDLALRAGLAHGVGTDVGGLGERLPNGCLWFEELTTPALAKAGRSPHICNGHIWATLQLVRLAQLTGDDRIAMLAAEGQRSLKLMLEMYCNGQWIRYDLSPRRYEVRFCLAFEADASSLDGKACGPLVCKAELARVDPEDNSRGGRVELCIGMLGDDSGAWRLLNSTYGQDFGVVTWGDPLLEAAEHGRRIRQGKSVFIMELPPGADTDYFREPYLRLRVWYVDSGSGGSLDALVFSWREQVYNEYSRLPGVPHRLVGDGQLKVLEKTVRVCDLGKSSNTAWKITNAYVNPLRELGRQTGDPFFETWARRLEGQIEALKAAYPALEFGKR